MFLQFSKVGLSTKSIIMIKICFHVNRSQDEFSVSLTTTTTKN